MKHHQRASSRDWRGLALLCVFLTVAALFGGASRPDVLSLPILRGLTCVIGAVGLAFLPTSRSSFKALGAMLACFALLIAIQLVPLPFGLWSSLPGRSTYAIIAELDPSLATWRPISIAPTRTLNSLFALTVPAVTLILIARVSRLQWQNIAYALIVIGLMSGLLGVLQLIGDPEGPLYLYRITNRGSAVGFFANRNHHAASLASLMPVLGLLAVQPPARRGPPWFWPMILGSVALFLAFLIIATGSRAGLALLALGLLAAGAIIFLGSDRAMTRRLRGPALLCGGAVFVGLMAIYAMLPGDRQLAVTRSAQTEVANEWRVQLAPKTIAIAAEHFPFGSGFGSFEYAFRKIEPDEMLSTSYVNHAHNDVLEMISDGGVGAILLMIAFTIMWARTGWAAWTGVSGSESTLGFQRAGWSIATLLMLGSVVDYPLRTPYLSALVMIALFWASARERERSSADSSLRVGTT